MGWVEDSFTCRAQIASPWDATVSAMMKALGGRGPSVSMSESLSGVCGSGVPLLGGPALMRARVARAAGLGAGAGAGAGCAGVGAGAWAGAGCAGVAGADGGEISILAARSKRGLGAGRGLGLRERG